MKKLLIYSISSLLIIASCASNPKKYDNDSSSSDSSMNTPLAIKTQDDVSYYPDKPVVKGFMAYPEKSGKYPALILIHEFWGLNNYIKESAKDFAKLGYVVLASDLYDGRATADQKKARELAASVRGNAPEALNNLKNAVNFLKTRNDVNPQRLASVGWCFGGMWSYQMAKNDLGVKATVMYYGNFLPADDLSQMKAHIIGHFGEKDMGIKVNDVKQFQATLKTLSGDHEIYIYPNAGHGFANPENQNYVKESAESAWIRTVEFLKKNL